MDFESQDQDIIRLLTKLKNSEALYPEHMMVARRQMYLRRMAEINLGISPDAGVRNPLKHTDTPPVSPVTGTLLETALLVAILVEASAVAYFYRDELSDFFQSMTGESRVQAVEPMPVVATMVDILGVTPSPAMTATVPSVTLSTSPTAMIATLPGTPVPGLAGENNNNSGTAGDETTNTTSNTGNTGNPSTTQSESTPVPNVDNGNDNDDQGNHYGQTPRPERTKETDNNDNPAPENSDSQPAPEQNTDPAPPDNARPTRENRNP
jgi:hypothetical protein